MASSGGYYPYEGDDPAGVASAMADLRFVGDALGALAGEVEHDTRSIMASWPKGRTGQLAAADAARMGGALDESQQAFAGAERGLCELHEVLVSGRRKVNDLNFAYEVLAGPSLSYEGLLLPASGHLPLEEELRLAEETLGVARTRSGFESLADVDRAHALVQTLVAQETSVCEDLLNRLADEASGLPGHAAGKSRYDVSFGLLWDANQVADVLSGKVRFPSDPQAIHDAWLLLSADQRTELLLADPLRFGNLNGIPVADRDVANRATLKQQLDLLFRAFVSAHLPVPLSREDLDRMSPGTLAGLERFSGLSVREFRQALLLKAQLDRNTSGVTLLMAYEPGVYGGKGRAAIAFGDPDHADNVAFCVPGLLSSVDKIGDLAGDALNLNGQAFQADPRHKTAIIAWQGYDAPDVFSVASEDSAERGARLLAADVNAMRTTHAGAIGKLTVVGHSYGSTTTGLALQREGMKVDQVALIGSPGVGGEATTVADLHLNRSQVFVGSASRDLVTSITTILPINDFLGLDPSLDTFGATRFKAESVKRGDNNNTADHSLYYDAFNESESLYALADIVSGHGDRLGQDGMLAQPRHIEVVPTGEGRSTAVTRDPEDLRAPSAGFDHAFDAGIPSP